MVIPPLTRAVRVPRKQPPALEVAEFSVESYQLINPAGELPLSDLSKSFIVRDASLPD